MRLGTRVHFYEPENKARQVGPWSPRPKKFKTLPSAGEVMATVVWDAKGVILLDILPKRSTMTGMYFENLEDQLRTAIRENAEINSLKAFCCNRTTQESTLAKLQLML